jgi:hypothetical protein
MSGNKYITIICRCGNSKAVPEELCLHYPGGSITCDQLTKEHTKCKMKYSTMEILKKARGSDIADFSQPQLIQESLIK